MVLWVGVIAIRVFTCDPVNEPAPGEVFIPSGLLVETLGLVRLALFVAPKKLELLMARGLVDSFKAYASMLGDEIMDKEKAKENKRSNFTQTAVSVLAYLLFYVILFNFFSIFI